MDERTKERCAENMRDPQFLGLQFTRRHRCTNTRTLDTYFRALAQARTPTFRSREHAIRAKRGLRRRRHSATGRKFAWLVRFRGAYALILKEPFLLKEPFPHRDGVPGPERERQRHGRGQERSAHYAREIDADFVAARTETAGDRDRILNRRAVDERILSGDSDFAEDEERAKGFDFDRNAGIAQISLPQTGLDRRPKLRGRQTSGAHRADQRRRDIPRPVDRKGLREAFLAKNHHANAIAARELITGADLRAQLFGAVVGR